MCKKELKRQRARVQKNLRSRKESQIYKKERKRMRVRD